MALTFPGNTDYEQSSPARWQTSGWDLDHLVVPFQGDVAQFDAYLATLTPWEASAIDGDMFLDMSSNDAHRQFPTLELTYIGKKGGVLPPDKNAASQTIQQVRFNLFPTEGVTFWIELTYIAPISTKRVFGRDPVDIATIGANTPADVTVVWWVAHWENVTPDPLPTNAANTLSWFLQKESVTGDSEELVPGEYYVGTQVKQNLLFSSQA